MHTLPILILLVAGHVTAQNATQQDVEDAENRLQGSIEGIDLQVANLDSNITAMLATIATLTQQVGNVTGGMAQLNNDTYQDHVNIYAALTRALFLHDANGHIVYQNNKTVPLLPLVFQNQQKLLENQQAIITSQFRTRGDLDNATELIEAGFSTTNEGNEAIFSRVDNSNGKVTMLAGLAGLQFLVNMVLLSAYLRWPARFWAWKDYQEKRIERRGDYVPPPCPKAGQDDLKGNPLQIGSYFVCPVKDACPSGEDCKRIAIDEMERAAVQDPGDMPAPATEKDDGVGGEDKPEREAPKPARQPPALVTVTAQPKAISDDDFGGA